MKIAVTFFGNSKNNKPKDALYNKYNRINKEKESVLNHIDSISKIRNKYTNKFKNNKININNKSKFKILLSVSICIMLILNLNLSSMLFMCTSIFKLNNVEISKEKIMSLNYLANSSNYVYRNKEVEKEEKPKEEYDETTLAEEILMDEMTNENIDIAAFNSFDSIDIKINVENENYQKLNVCGVDITNYSTNRNIDFKEILSIKDKSFSKGVDEVLLYTTHTSESYAQSEKYSFDYSSPRRSVDGKYNMLSISSTLARNLNNKGINTICSLTPHDYGEYNSAYMNSRRTFEEVVTQNPNVKLAIDVHRDAIEDLDFAPKIEFKGYKVASLMFVMGIGYDDGYNPYYKENLKLALQIQMLANKIYPGLFRPMIIRNSIYNQDIRENSFLVEVGASGNTIDEAKLATRCLANLLNILFKD